jgi:small multidrug resistance pump
MTKFFIYIAIVNTFDFLAILAGKMWSITHKPLYIIACSLGFAVAGFFFALSLKYEGSAITNVIWIGISVILVTIMGYFLFKEHISALQFLGIAFILFGLALVNIR